MNNNITNDSTAASNKNDERYENLSQGAATKPTPYCIYPGKVSQVDLQTRTLDTVILGDFNVNHCKMMCDTLSQVLGFTSTALPAVGTEVLVVYTPGGNSYVIGGAQPDYIAPPKAARYATGGDYSDTNEFVNKIAYGTSRHESIDSFIGRGANSPFDMLPGEKEWTMNTGVLIRLLYNFAQMSAGDLAKVEVGLMNDMVRIVDNYFVHHNVGGDTLIWSSGKTTQEDHFTSHGFEAEGKTSEHEPLCSEGRGSYYYDPKASTGDDYQDVDKTGRWRKSTYIGYLGDMLHTWISDPTKVISTWNSSLDAYRTGRCRHWLGTDGSVMVQAVGAIHLEVAPRVIIPVVPHKWDNPEIDIVKKMENLNSEFLKIWQGDAAWIDCRTAAWQMRSYARYMTQWHSLARWRMMEAAGLAKVPTEPEGNEPKAGCEEKERKKVVIDSIPDYFASFTMDQGGGISMIANGHTSVVMNNGDIQIAGPGNLEVKMAGMISFIGRSISLKAIDNIEIAAICGKLWLRARAAWNAICERGRMWLKSDMKPAWGINYGDIAGSYPLPNPPIKPEKENCSFGIVIDTVDRPILIKGERGVMVSTKEKDSPIYLKTKRGIKKDDRSAIWMVSGGHIALQAKKNIFQYAKKCIGMHAETAMGISTNVLKISDKFIMRGGSIHYDGMILTDGMIISNPGFQSTNPTVGKLKKPLPLYLKHKQIDEEVYPIVQKLEEKEEEWLGEASPIIAKPLWDIDEPDNYKWKHWDWKAEGPVLGPTALKREYMQDTKETGMPEKVKEPLIPTQQLTAGNMILLGHKETDPTHAPYPDLPGQMFKFNEGKYPLALGKIGSKKYEAGDIGKISDMQPVQWKFYIRKDDTWDYKEFR